MQTSYTSTLSSKGQLIFPSALRHSGKLKSGHKATITRHKKNKNAYTVTFVPEMTLDQAYGSLKTDKPFVPLDQIREQVYYAIGKYRAQQMKKLEKQLASK